MCHLSSCIVFSQNVFRPANIIAMVDWALITICLQRLICVSIHQNASLIWVFILPHLLVRFLLLLLLLMMLMCVVVFSFFYAFLSFLSFVLQSCAHFLFSTSALRKSKEMPPTHPGAVLLHFLFSTSALRKSKEMPPTHPGAVLFVSKCSSRVVRFYNNPAPLNGSMQFHYCTLVTREPEQTTLLF